MSLRPLAARIVPMLADTVELVERAVARSKKVLFEGAQGTLLDIDHGTYPFVTSSHATAGGACTGTGVGPSRIDAVVGLVKAYCTRVGGGPFPTELTDAIGERLRKRGDEFGSVTGRPRRTGWLDLPALRYAVRVNGLDGLALTKLDVLTGLAELQICVAYDTAHGRTDELPDRRHRARHARVRDRARVERGARARRGGSPICRRRRGGISSGSRKRRGRRRFS